MNQAATYVVPSGLSQFILATYRIVDLVEIRILM